MNKSAFNDRDVFGRFSGGVSRTPGSNGGAAAGDICADQKSNLNERNTDERRSKKRESEEIRLKGLSQKKPRTAGAGLESERRGSRARLPSCPAYMWVISRSLVSGRKIRPITKLIAAIMIGYHRPE